MAWLVRRDASQGPIAQALLDVGLPVRDTSAVGDGFSDLLTMHVDGYPVLIECKTPGARTKPKTRAKQKEFARLFKARKCETIEQALKAVGVLK
jgi:hypothetical protein